MKKELGFLLVILGLHIVVLAKLIFFPYPELFVYPYLTNAGLIPYMQIFDQHFPGLMFLPINLNNLGMTSPESARVWLIGLSVITQLLIYFITRKITKSHKKAALTSLVYFLWQPFLEGWVFWLENFLPLFYLPAFYFCYLLLEKKGKSKNNAILTGLFLGAAILFKQIALPLAFLVLLLVYFKTKNLRLSLFYLAGLIPIPFLMVLYYTLLGALWDFLYWSVWFNVTVFAKYGTKGAEISQLLKVIGIFSPVLLLKYFKNKTLLLTLLVFFIGALAGVFDRFDFVHFQAAIPFLAIIIGISLDEVIKRNYLKILSIGYLLVAFYLLFNFYRYNISEKVYFFEPQILENAKIINKYAKPNEEVYLFGPPAHLYFLSNTIPAGRIFVFQFPWFMMVSEDKFLNALENGMTKLVVRDRSVSIEGQKITDFAKKLDLYIEQNYEVVEKSGNNEYMLRK